nr:YraN family protein [uncultured Catonella sp.]
MLKREIGSGDINKRSLGSIYEKKAVDYLLSKGYKILEKNYLRNTGEIDIVALSSDNYLIAIEVKYRSSDKYGSPFSAVTYAKQRKIYKTLLFYLNEHNMSMETKCRFDVIGIYKGGKLFHLTNAFEVC